MRDTGFGVDDLRGAGETHAHGFAREADGSLRVISDHPISGRYASGGAFTSPDDMARFARALAGEGFLSDASRDEVLRRFDPEREGAGVLTGSGHVPGFTHLFRYDIDADRLVLTMTNLDAEGPEDMMALHSAIDGALGVEPATPKTRVLTVRSARDGLPDTAIGIAVTEWLDAVASGDARAVYEIRMKHGEPSDGGPKLRDFCKQVARSKETMGGFDVVGYLEQEDGSLLVVVRGTKQEARMTFAAPGEGETGAIGGIDIEVVRAPRNKE
jgi:hypothetical protein